MMYTSIDMNFPPAFSLLFHISVHHDNLFQDKETTCICPLLVLLMETGTVCPNTFFQCVFA
jgi:hypothetical protein